MSPGLMRDAIELARADCGELSARSVVKAVLFTDSFRILMLQRAREFARALRVPMANHVLRSAQSTVFGIEIDRNVTLGRGIYFVHTHAIVIGGDARIGDRVRFYGSNTIGTARDDGYPIIEEDVWIGSGARILGPITIGARSRIGANAVVLNDVPPDSVAVGMPARVLPRDRDRR